jgi:benzodiazapine receptor
MAIHPLGRQAVALLAFLALTAVAAALGGWASVDAARFYAALDRPSWAPPAWLFGPAWTLLYTLMAVAAWLVWRAPGRDGAAGALWLYGVQLAVNALWSWLFFAWQLGFWAFFGAVALWLLVGATAAAFWPHRRLAAALLLPYLGWVTFATALTWSVWRRNPALLGT